MTDMQFQQAHSSLRSGENKSEVEGLLCENKVLRLLSGATHPTRVHRETNDHVEAMLSRFNGHPIALKEFYSATADDKAAFKVVMKRGLIRNVSRGMYELVKQ